MRKKLKFILIIIAILGGVCAVSVVFINMIHQRNHDNDVTKKTATQIRTVRISFPEGFCAVQIAEKLEEKGVCEKSDFLDAVMNIDENNIFYDNVKNLKDRPFALEGYLFPDTYDFYVPESAESVLNRFIVNMKNKYKSEYQTKAAELNFSMDDVIIFASIIQDECSNPADMKKVSSVLHNRLNSKDFPKLQCDSTYYYIKDFVKPFIKDEKEYERLYNLYYTYKCNGLSAGPICSPGKDAIEAALYPEKTDYFYFVTDKQGVFYYAKTLKEHNDNLKKANIQYD